MADVIKRFGHVIDYRDLTYILEDFGDLVKKGKAKKMPYGIWREMSAATGDDWALFDIEWDTDGYGVYIDIFYNNDSWHFHTGDGSFGDFIYEHFLRGCEMDLKANYVPNAYIDSDGRQYYEYYDTRAGKSTIYADVLAAKSDYAASEPVYNALATKADLCEINRIDETVNKLCESATLAAPLKKNENNNNTKKESFAMKFNFDFGPVNPSTVRMSLYGLAVKNKAGTWVSYDAKAGDIMDVDILNFDGAKFLYKMPVATKDIAIGDVVIHNGIPMFVIAIATNGAYITAVDPINGERKDIMLPKSPFGFNFATKVVNFLGNLNTGADASNPFGNLGLMMMLSEDGNGVKDMLPLMLMANGGNVDMSNPLMMYALMGNDSKSGNDNILPILMMLNAQHPVAPVNSGCTCGHCGENHTQN